jgi:hypothetical protein
MNRVQNNKVYGTVIAFHSTKHMGRESIDPGSVVRIDRAPALELNMLNKIAGGGGSYGFIKYMTANMWNTRSV